MNKKEIFIPLLVLTLSITFVMVSLAVMLTKGKSRKWIKRKMRIGALLLMLNAFTTGSAQEIEVSCYDIAESNVMSLKNGSPSMIFTKNEKKIVERYIDYRIGTDYSYCLINQKNETIQKGKIEALDGKFDKWKEDIEIEFKKDLKPGRYFLLLYDISTNKQDKNNYRTKIQIDIKDE